MSDYIDHVGTGSKTSSREGGSLLPRSTIYRIKKKPSSYTLYSLNHNTKSILMYVMLHLIHTYKALKKSSPYKESSAFMAKECLVHKATNSYSLTKLSEQQKWVTKIELGGRHAPLPPRPIYTLIFFSVIQYLPPPLSHGIAKIRSNWLVLTSIYFNSISYFFSP